MKSNPTPLTCAPQREGWHGVALSSATVGRVWSSPPLLAATVVSRQPVSRPGENSKFFLSDKQNWSHRNRYRVVLETCLYCLVFRLLFISTLRQLGSTHVQTASK